MASNKENMRQAMKELLGLVGFGPEEGMEQKAEEVSQAAPVSQPTAAERPAAVHTATRTVERPVEQPTAAARPVEKKVEETPVEEQVTARPAAHTVEQTTELEEPRRKAATTERSFFSFGEPKEPIFGSRVKPAYTPPVEEEPFIQEEEPEHAPFIRPGATVIAAGATFFGDLRAEGDVEVLGKLKGNLEATGNVRVVGKVLGDVKGEAVVLAGCTVQGNVTSTSFVTLDGMGMVVGDVLATDFESAGRVKGNLQIARAATFAPSAVLAGNVIAGTIVMSQGARIQGAVRIAEDPETNSLFGEGLEI